MAILLTAIATVVLASILEGLLHQFILHTPQKKLLGGVLYGAFHSHAIEHHPAYRAESYHQPPNEKESKISLGWYTLPLVLAILSPIAYLLWRFVGVASAITFMGTLVAYYTTYELLHWHMHFPKNDGTRKKILMVFPFRQIFDWFDRRHYVHHLADDRNYNVVIPVYDLLTGRYTTDIEKVPWANRLRTKRNLKKSQALRASTQKK
jgi:hypothetical protein